MLRHLFVKIMKHTRGSINREERYAQIITRKLLRSSDAELMISPTDGKYYIKANQGDIFVVICIDGRESSISIINHKYKYKVALNARAAENIESWFIQEVECRRREMELEFTSNVEHSLYNIAMNI